MMEIPLSIIPDDLQIKGHEIPEPRIELTLLYDFRLDATHYILRLESFASMQVIYTTPRLKSAEEVLDHWPEVAGDIAPPFTAQNLRDMTRAEMAALRITHFFKRGA